MAFWSSYSPPSLYLPSIQLVIVNYKHQDTGQWYIANPVSQSHNSIQCLSLQEAAFHLATVAGWRFLKLTTTFQSEWHIWNEGRPRSLMPKLTHEWTSFCSCLSKTMKMDAKEIAWLNCVEGFRKGGLCTCTLYNIWAIDQVIFYHLFISEEDSLWLKNCEQSLDICFNKSSLSSSRHLSLVLFHLLIWRDERLTLFLFEIKYLNSYYLIIPKGLNSPECWKVSTLLLHKVSFQFNLFLRTIEIMKMKKEDNYFLVYENATM